MPSGFSPRVPQLPPPEGSPLPPLPRRTLLGLAVTSPNLSTPPPQFSAAHTHHTGDIKKKKNVGHVDVSAAAAAARTRACAAPRGPARPRGRRGGAGRRAGGRRGGRGERGYLDGVRRLLESDQHVPVSPAGRVPGSELRRGDKAEGEARGGAGTPPARRCPPPRPPPRLTRSPPRPRPAAPHRPLPSRSLSPPLARQRRYLHESLYSAFGYVQIGGAQMGALVHGGGRVYQEE